MAGYDRQQAGDTLEISTTPEKVPVPWLFFAIPGVLLILIGFAISIIVGLLAVGFMYGAIHLLTHSKQATQYRQPARFRVSKSGVEAGGTTIPREAIHRVIVRNHVLKAAESVIVVADPRAHSGQQNVVAGMNWAISNLGPISYRVDAEARGVPTTLAGGLTEPTATAIAMDVAKCLHMEAAAAAAGN